MANFPYVTFVSVVSFSDVTIPAFCFCSIFSLHIKKRTLHVGSKIRILCSRGKNNISLEHKIHIFSSRHRVISSMYFGGIDFPPFSSPEPLFLFAKTKSMTRHCLYSYLSVFALSCYKYFYYSFIIFSPLIFLHNYFIYFFTVQGSFFTLYTKVSILTIF